jgi:hypothetical protein
MAKSKGGRPPAITKEVAETLFLAMAEGRSLRQIAALPGMPGKSTILRMAVSTNKEHAWFRDQYAQALRIRAFGLAEEMIDIADDGSNDWYDFEISPETDDAEAIVIKKPDTEHINRSRLRIDTRKWALSKLLPKEFGDKVEHEHSGEIIVNINRKPRAD